MERRDSHEHRAEFYVVRALGYALAHKHKSLDHALLYAQENELKRFRRGIPLLDIVITPAPLLGLLGTVTGMMGSFSLIGGELGTPGAITGGIAEALIATAFGLGIAITALIPFNVLNFRRKRPDLKSNPRPRNFVADAAAQKRHKGQQRMHGRIPGLQKVVDGRGLGSRI